MNTVNNARVEIYVLVTKSDILNVILKCFGEYYFGQVRIPYSLIPKEVMNLN